jgi:hypothetical protein
MTIVVIVLEMIFTGKAGRVTHVVVVWQWAAQRHQLCPQPPNDGVPRLNRPLQALVKLQQLTVHLRHLTGTNHQSEREYSPIRTSTRQSGRDYSPIRTRLLANQDAITRQSGRDYSPIRTRLLANQDATSRQSGREYSPIRTRILANQIRGHLHPIFFVL